tara:strand:- start:2439 stop:3140 length:702 start_codon:yes stop_codon:yes gene_type:complete
MSRRRSATPGRRNANTNEETIDDSEPETDEERPLLDYDDGYDTEDEPGLNHNNIDIHRNWLSKELSENDRPFIGDAKKMWKRLPPNLKLTLLPYVTEEYGKDLELEAQKKLIHELLKSYHKGRNGKNNEYGHFIGSKHRPCCTPCDKSCMGKLCGGKTHYCKECKRTLLHDAFYFEKNEHDNDKMKCKPAKKIEGGYKRTRRRRKKNRKKRTKKKARRKRRRRSSKRRRRRKR